MTPYREDPAWLPELAQHVGIAKELLQQVRMIPRQIRHASEVERHALLSEAIVSWDGVWEQLGEARAIAHRGGRDVARDEHIRRLGVAMWVSARDVRDGGWGPKVAACIATAEGAIHRFEERFPGMRLPPAWQPPRWFGRLGLLRPGLSDCCCSSGSRWCS
jgi:hypothetical protein